VNSVLYPGLTLAQVKKLKELEKKYKLHIVPGVCLLVSGVGGSTIPLAGREQGECLRSAERFLSYITTGKSNLGGKKK
jgi:hypothetical protein